MMFDGIVCCIFATIACQAVCTAARIRMTTLCCSSPHHAACRACSSCNANSTELLWLVLPPEAGTVPCSEDTVLPMIKVIWQHKLCMTALCNLQRAWTWTFHHCACGEVCKEPRTDHMHPRLH